MIVKIILSSGPLTPPKCLQLLLIALVREKEFAPLAERGRWPVVGVGHSLLSHEDVNHVNHARQAGGDFSLPHLWGGSVDAMGTRLSTPVGQHL